jgi:hypothetical protein
MGIALKAEWKTDVEGSGDGFVKITQYQDDGEQTVWLSLNQFQRIISFEKTLTREAVGSE